MNDAGRTLLGIALMSALLLRMSPAAAGPTDTPLPTFSDGKPAVAVYDAYGVIKNNNLETDFICTNIDSMAVDIGVEVLTCRYRHCH